MNGHAKISKGNKIFFAAILALLVIASNVLQQEDPAKAGPSICSKRLFAWEQGGREWLNDVDNNRVPPLDEWFFVKTPPGKYRILGKIPIYLTFRVMEISGMGAFDSLYYSYLLWAFAFLALFLYHGGRFIESSLRSAISSGPVAADRIFFPAAAVLCLLPPVLFAFKFPVHGSPNDFLGYALIALSLQALHRQKLARFTGWTALSLLCRETNLIVLFPLMAMPTFSWRKRFSVAGGLILLLAVYRLSLPGESVYDPYEAGSIHNFTYPYESLLFLSLVFGPFWSIGILGNRLIRHDSHANTPILIALSRTFYAATVAVIIIVLAGARFREIRIEYILFFYYVTFGIYYVYHRWPIWSDKANIKAACFSAWLSMIITLIIYLAFLSGDMIDHPARANLLQYFFDGFGGGWVRIFTVLLFIWLFISVLDILTIWQARQPARGLDNPVRS